jgi:DNA modification methylase
VWPEEGGRLLQGDCLDLLPHVEDGSVGIVLADPPYGVTDNAWDVRLDLTVLWRELKRVLRPGGAVVMFSTFPYSAILLMSNRKWFRYGWIWLKSAATNFMHVKKGPLRLHEHVLVFCRNAPVYNPVMERGSPYASTGKEGKLYERRNYRKMFRDIDTINEEGTRYPLDVLPFPQVNRPLHPTQKPVELCEYLIRTHSNPGDMVLDFCAGSGTTAVAAIGLGRPWLAMEKDPDIYLTAMQRTAEAYASRERSLVKEAL